MARQKKKQQRRPADRGGKSSSIASPPSTDATERQPSPLAGLVLSAGLVVVWIAALAGLAWLTAEETLLNRSQVRQADLVVTGRVVDAARGTVAVEKIWKPARAETPPGGQTLTVVNLSQSRARLDAAYLLPLTRVGRDTYEITRPQLKDERATQAEALRPPRIYPANPHTEEQLRQLLDESLRAGSIGARRPVMQPARRRRSGRWLVPFASH